MKQTLSFITVLAIAVTTLFSCKKDDNNSNNGTTDPAKLIIGKWQLVSAISSEPYQWTSTYKGTDGVAAYGPCLTTSTATFSEGTTAGTGTVLTYNDCLKSNSSGSYIIQNNLLTVDGYQRPILKLNATELVLTSAVDVGTHDVIFSNTYKK